MPSLVVVFFIGPVPVSRTVVTTWGVMLVLVLAALWLTRGGTNPRGIYLLPELFLESMDGLIDSMMGARGRRYLPFIATIALFVTAGNLAGVIPGAIPPTADLATPAAVGFLVFSVVHITGLREKGLLGYAREYFQPYWWLFPLNLAGAAARPLSHIFRLYGNLAGGGILMSVTMLLAPWLVPVPVIAWFSVFIGIVQGFVFTLLAVAYIAEAL
ncbi:MAG: F0F1 ATP synthase subunit A [Bacillota bacterium]